MILTLELLEKGKSTKGGFNSAQIKELGTYAKNNKGWYRGLIGKEIPDENYTQFLRLKDAHLKNKFKPNRKHIPTHPDQFELDLDDKGEEFDRQMEEADKIMKENPGL